jgi:hypothetical protein
MGIEKEEILFTTRTIEELEPDVCYGLCKEEERVGCEKQKKCLIRLFGAEEDSIAGFDVRHIKTGEDYKKRKIAVERWREENFKECRGYTFIIRENQ